MSKFYATEEDKKENSGSETKKRAPWWVPVTGWGGGIILLYAYYLIQTGKVQSHDRIYIILNVIGSALILLNVLYHKAYPSALVNLVWLLIGGYTLIKMSQK